MVRKTLTVATKAVAGTRVGLQLMTRVARPNTASGHSAQEMEESDLKIRLDKRGALLQDVTLQWIAE
jgi:hypothetical protein